MQLSNSLTAHYLHCLSSKVRLAICTQVHAERRFFICKPETWRPGRVNKNLLLRPLPPPLLLLLLP